MALQHSPRIVTDGLVLCLDAANPKSYTGSGTAWRDLSGRSNDASLVAGATYDSGNFGSIDFDGTDDLATTSMQSSVSFSWSVWFKTDVVNDGYRNLISIRQNSYMLMLMELGSSSMGFWSPDGLAGDYLNMNPITINTWYNAVFVREGNNITNGYKAYLNGEFRGSKNTGTWSSTDPVIIGGRTDVAQYFKGNIAHISIHNRALTATEVSQNFNALRGRFGL